MALIDSVRSRCSYKFGPYNCTQLKDHFGPCQAPGMLSMLLDRVEWLRAGINCELCEENLATSEESFDRFDQKFPKEQKGLQYILLCDNCKLGYKDNQDES